MENEKTERDGKIDDTNVNPAVPSTGAGDVMVRPRIKNDEPFAAAKGLIEENRELIDQFGLFGSLTMGFMAGIDNAWAEKEVFCYLYSQHRERALDPIKFSDDVLAPALRAAYRAAMPSQRIFDFIVCSTLMAYRSKGIDKFVPEGKIIFAPIDNLVSVVDVRDEFGTLRGELQAKGEKPWWIQDCCEAFGERAFKSWVDAQIDHYEAVREVLMRRPHLDVAQEYIQAIAPVDGPQISNNTAKDSKSNPAFNVTDYEKISVEEARHKLDVLIGMDGIKEEISSLLNAMLFDVVHAKACGHKLAFDFRNFAFEGAPGVGKTTVAQAIGALMSAEGLLPSKKAVFCSGSALIGAWIGHTEKNIHELFTVGRGGMIIIDEADVLAQRNATSFQDTAINTLNTLIGHEVGKGTVVVLTGYPKGMKDLFDQNPGLASRFPNRFAFPNYDGEGLRNIFDSMVIERGFVVEPDVVSFAMEQILEAKESLGDRFGNARAVGTFVDVMKKAHANNIGSKALVSMLDPGNLDLAAYQRLIRFTFEDLPVFDEATGTFKTPMLCEKEALRPNAKKNGTMDTPLGYH